MYAYEVQCEHEFVNCFYPTVNKFLEREIIKIYYIVLCIVYCMQELYMIPEKCKIWDTDLHAVRSVRFGTPIFSKKCEIWDTDLQ